MPSVFILLWSRSLLAIVAGMKYTWPRRTYKSWTLKKRILTSPDFKILVQDCNQLLFLVHDHRVDIKTRCSNSRVHDTLEYEAPPILGASVVSEFNITSRRVGNPCFTVNFSLVLEPSYSTWESKRHWLDTM